MIWTARSWTELKTYNLFMTFNTLVLFTSYKYYQLTRRINPSADSMQTYKMTVKKHCLHFVQNIYTKLLSLKEGIQNIIGSLQCLKFSQDFSKFNFPC